MADVKWIKITTDMFDDEKIDFIQSLPEADAIIVVWVRLLTLAGKCNAGGYIYLTENIPYEPEMLAHKFRKQISTINLALATFRQLGMVEQDGNGLYISNWEKHQNIDGLDKIREQNKLRVRKYRESLKLTECNVTSNVTVTQSNAIDIDKDKEEDIKIYSPVIEYLNERAGTKFRATTDKTKKLINARVAENFTLDDFKKVINTKCDEWTGSEMEQYLRPETLFGTKFEGYLNQNKPTAKKKRTDVAEIEHIERI